MMWNCLDQITKSSVSPPLTITDALLALPGFVPHTHTHTHTQPPLSLPVHLNSVFPFLQVSGKPREEPLWGCALPGPNKSEADKTKWPHSGRWGTAVFSGALRET